MPLPLLLAEFAPGLAREYPIVFAEGRGDCDPVALTVREKPLPDKATVRTPGTAATRVRRFPFVFVETSPEQYERVV